MTLMYHGTDTDLTDATLAEGVCLALSPDEADQYSGAGRVWAVEIPALIATADEDDLADAATRAGFDYWADFGGIFAAADRADVRAILAADGWQAVRYVDQLGESDATHVCVRLLATGIGRIVGPVAV